jgi:hypothetical protein
VKLAHLVCVTLLALSAATAAVSASAQTPGPSTRPDGDGAPQRAERRGPPPESIAACQALAAGQACAFTSPKGPEKGSCTQGDTGAPLACRPERRGPPPEAMAACKDKKPNDVCTFVSPAGKETGLCVQHDAGSAPGCRPTRN